MPTPKKLETINLIKEKFEKAQSLIFTDFKGLSVEQISDFRTQLREEGAEYRIYKNTLSKIAIDGKEYSEEVSKVLEGTTAVVLGMEDPVAPLRVLKKFEKTSKIPIKLGVIDGKTFGLEELKVLRELPGRDQLRGILLGTIQAPIKNFVTLLSAPSRDLLSLLKQKGEE